LGVNKGETFLDHFDKSFIIKFEQIKRQKFKVKTDDREFEGEEVKVKSTPIEYADGKIITPTHQFPSNSIIIFLKRKKCRKNIEQESILLKKFSLRKD